MDEPVLAECPTCGVEEHVVLHATPQNVTLRCLGCQETRSETPPRSRTIEIRIVLSDGESSWGDRIEVGTKDIITVGDEFEWQDHRFIVTGIEDDKAASPPKAEATQVKTVFAKRFDTVPLKFAVNDGPVTRSYALNVEPETEVHIGQVFQVGDVKLVVKTLKSDQNRTLHKGFLMARNVRRAFCDEAPHWVKEGKILPTRKRGAPAGAKRVPRHGPARP